MKHLSALSLSIGLVLSAGVITDVTAEDAPVETVDYVDVESYMGLWYEISTIPAIFQAGCTGTTASYALNDDGTVEVVNDCNMFWLGGPLRSAEAVAEVANPDTNAELKVFFGSSPVGGDYWIIGLDEENYEWALVGEPSRQFLWVLSRTPRMDDDLYNDILDIAADQGYDTGLLVETRQPRR